MTQPGVLRGGERRQITTGVKFAVLLRKPKVQVFAMMSHITPTLSWHPDADVTPNPREVMAMAEVLEGCHGIHAAGVAEFFSTHHSLTGDAGRCWAWAGVAETIKQRAVTRHRQV